MSMKDGVKATASAAAAKAAAARAALQHVTTGMVIGVGSGTTAAAFIDALREWDGPRPVAAVASSEATARLLTAIGIDVTPLPPSGHVALYVDGADASDVDLRLVKGHGGAHAREKVLASAATTFVCIMDDTKPATSLMGQPVPVEYLPMARSFVAREIERIGGRLVHREGFTTDNGNDVSDVHDLDLSDPGYMEGRLEEIPGVVACGIFARRPADILLIGSADGSVRTLRGPR
jgi:ribose 5-phosphate isomerase A